MCFIRWIAGFVITVAAAVFAVLNRHDVTVFWNPVADDSLTVPVYLVVLGFTALGFFLGAAAVWMNMGRLRSERRKQKKEIKALNRQVASAEAVSLSKPVSSPAHGEANLPVLSVHAE